MLLTDLEDKYLFRNSAYWTSRGYEVGGAIPLDGYASVHPGDVPLLKAKMSELLQKGSSASEYRVRHRDGTWMYQSAKSRVIYDDLGKPKYILSIIRDVTELNKLQEKLMAQDRLASIGLLVAGVAHELNNPLTSVIGFSELLINRDNLPEDIIDDLKIVNKEANRTSSILKKLLTFARTQHDGKKSIDVNEIINTVLSLREHEYKVNNIQVDLNLMQDQALIFGNASQLQQVFFNIIINAEQSMLEAHNKGTLTITTKQSGDRLRVSFSDDGSGISPDDMHKLFTPFFTTKGVGKGTGLGLSVCHGIIAEHGGRIYAESDLGNGATFIVELPIETKS